MHLMAFKFGVFLPAHAVLRQFQVGDYLLLLKAAGPGGSFAYVGRAIAKPSRECFDLNCHRMLHRKYPAMDWETLKDLMAKIYVDRH
jgi:hypothetical protein